MTDNSIHSFGIGIGTQSSNGDWLEVYFHQPLLSPDASLINAVKKITDYQSGNQSLSINSSQAKALAAAVSNFPEQSALLTQLSTSQQPLVIVVQAMNDAPEDAPQSYLKLHLLSHRLVKPHQVNLDGAFATLPNVAWTNLGAIALDELAQRQLEARLQGQIIEVMSVDKFPKMTNYVVPTGIRVAHTARVRLGAHLGEGTTIMHEGFVNFNAGTEGPGMVEGRISAGVWVGKGSDIGGGASTMGTLSGGGKQVISVGDGCLIGANGGTGIPLGDRCTIEAGLYLTAGSKVMLVDKDGNDDHLISARELAGSNDLLFRRNSKNGRVECLTNQSAIELNSQLHSHN